MTLKILCEDCKITYQINLFEFIFKKKGCPICHNKEFKFALGQYDKIR